jgi:hypothetical protein
MFARTSVAKCVAGACWNVACKLVTRARTDELCDVIAVETDDDETRAVQLRLPRAAPRSAASRIRVPFLFCFYESVEVMQKLL